MQKGSGGIAYYKFDNTDIHRLLDYNPNQILTYKNELGEERKFRVSGVTDNFYHQEVDGMGFYTTYAASFANLNLQGI